MGRSQGRSLTMVGQLGGFTTNCCEFGQQAPDANKHCYPGCCPARAKSDLLSSNPRLEEMVPSFIHLLNHFNDINQYYIIYTKF
ncbi:hypothetical protein pb186bvf_006435, partial [Paramecium bursaria]